MYKLKVNKNGDGVSFVLPEDEFNAWITQIDSVLDRVKGLKDEQAKNDIKFLKKTRLHLMTRSYFDTKTREAECFLSLFEFEIAVHFIAFDLPETERKNTPFKQALANPINKRR